MIIVQGITYIHPDGRDAFMAATARTIEQSRAEAGCVAYSCAEDVREPGTFHWFEAWADAAAFDAHILIEHHLEYVAYLEASGEVSRSRAPDSMVFEASRLSPGELVDMGITPITPELFASQVARLRASASAPPPSGAR